MSARVSDDDVCSALIWARNYGEIESYRSIAPRGRRWKIVLPEPVNIAGHDGDGLLLCEAVPTEIVLTSREALVFAYGCAVGGAGERRSEFAAREWGW